MDDGYDSGGKQRPFFDAVMDKPTDGFAEEDNNIPVSMLEGAFMESDIHQRTSILRSLTMPLCHGF